MLLPIMIWLFFATTDAAIEQGNFQSMKVSSTTLGTAVKNENLQTMSTLSCCIKASQESWSHLACLGNDNVCNLYDIELSSDYEEEGEEDVLNQCYRKMPEVCVYEEETYKLGETVAKNCDKNVSSVCTTFGWLPERMCPANYTYVSGSGCISVVQENIPHEASRTICTSQGAQLVIPGDFEALRQYLLCAYPESNYFRVGLRNRKWNDGRNVTANEWGEGEPSNDSDDVCGYMAFGREYKLNDRFCTLNLPFICQKI